MCVGTRTRTRSRTPIPLMGRAMCLDAIDWHPAGISRWAIQIALHDFLTLAFNSNYPVVDCVQAGSFCPFCQNRTQDRGVICLLRRKKENMPLICSQFVCTSMVNFREESDFHTPQKRPSSRRSFGVDPSYPIPIVTSLANPT